jgi:osmotically-inducible protein OsmY
MTHRNHRNDSRRERTDVRDRSERIRRPHEEDDDERFSGYDEAAHSGFSRYGFAEGAGGVFGTTGGGSYNGGFQIVEIPGFYDQSDELDEPAVTRSDRHTRPRDADVFDEVIVRSEERVSFRGRGPKNFQRSDERIREQIHDRLTDDHDVDASEIVIEVKGGEVTLTGTVEDRASKRRAGHLADTARGVVDVHNRLTIAKR